MDQYISLGVAAAILGTFVAVYFDVKYLVIPNILVFVMVLFSVPLAFLGGRLIQWALNVVFAFILFYMFWLIRVWAGGDSKLFIAVAALIPDCPGMAFGSDVSYQGFFFVSVLVNLLLVYHFYISIRILIKSEKKLGFLYELLILLSGMFSILVIADFLGLGSSVMIVSAALFGLSVIFLAHRYIVAAFIFCGVFLYMDLGVSIDLRNYSTVFFSIFALYIYNKASMLRFTKTVSISDLRLGDNLAEKIVLVEGNITREKEKAASVSSLLKDVFIKDAHALVKPVSCGVSEEDRKKLTELVESGKIEDNIEIYSGIIISPLILSALLLSVFVGDVVWILF